MNIDCNYFGKFHSFVITCIPKGGLYFFFWNQHGNIQIRAKVHTVNETILKLLALSVNLHLQSNFLFFYFYFPFYPLLSSTLLVLFSLFCT